MDRTSTPTTTRAGLVGALFTAGGVAWLLIGVITAVLGPFSGIAFGVIETAWIIIDAIFLVALVGLLNVPAISNRTCRIGLWIAIVARVIYLAAEVHSLALGSEFSPLLPAGALVTVVGMIVAGIGALRAGNRRLGWMIMIVGGYPLLFMVPLAIFGQELLGITGWGPTWSLLGIALASAWAPAGAAVPAHSKVERIDAARVGAPGADRQHSR